MVTSVALALLVAVLVVAASAPRWVALGIALAATLAFNFFFLPPVHTFTIADPQNVAALLAFTAAALIGSHLSTRARQRAREAVDSRNELARLFDLSRDILLTGESGTVESLARHIGRRFELDGVAVAVRTPDGWVSHQGGEAPLVVSDAQLEFAWQRASRTLEFDARERAYSGHGETEAAGGRRCALVPLRLGTTPIGVLVVDAGQLRAGTRDAIAGLAAMAVERDQFLTERRAADLVRRHADFTSTLLASLSHDLRTPLTAIQVAIGNLEDPALPAEARRDQARVAHSELDRLSRLFRDILDMARLDSTTMTPEREWVLPMDIVDAALANLDPEARQRTIRVTADEDALVSVDPRLTSAALSHLVENALQYSPAGSPIEIDARVTDAAVQVSVRDRGPGIDPSEAPRLFERFYRGRREQGRSPGSGMGLAITKGLLAVEQGRVWAENAPDGGARFTITVPAERRPVDAAMTGEG